MTTIRIPQRRDYPYLLVPAARFHERYPLVVSREPYAPEHIRDENVFIGATFLNDDGSLAEAGRSAILDRVKVRCRKVGVRLCVVWGPRSCTWIGRTGATHNGKRVPVSDTSDVFILARHDMPVENVWSIELPEGNEPPHLCVQRINGQVVEITPGGPSILAMFDDGLPDDLYDPASSMLGADGRLIPPARFRGHPVTGLSGDWNLVGPVQPDGEGIFLRDPWPEQVRAACERIAGRALPEHIIDAVWKVIDEVDSVTPCIGVLKAA